jgi:tripartite-type tricarboxylate transporter receptor subunit TctC
MKKRLFSVLLAGTMMLGLTACGSSTSGAASSSGSNSSSASSSKTSSISESSGGAADQASDIGFVRSETLNFVVPGKSGGGSDLAIRTYAQALQEDYGLKVSVTNYDSNTIGHQTVASAKPDGTTITLATSALNIQYLMGNSDVDPMKDFTLIAAMEDNGFSVLAVPADAPYSTFDDFVTYVKANPGTVNAGMPSSGANTMLFGMLQSKLGIQLNAVECSSESDRLTNLAGGFIDIGVVSIGNALEYEKAGKLKVIGTVGSDGSTISMYPDTLPDNYKTLQETGHQDLYFNVYHYILGPAGMDQAQVEKMNAALEKIADDCKDDIAKIGHIPGWHNLEDSQKIRKAEYDQDAEIATALGVNVR